MRRMNDGDIRELQRMLRCASKIFRRLPAPAEDGIYGSLTRAAVVIFQQCAGLPVTGDADEVTMGHLRRTADAAEEMLSPPAAVSPFRAGTVLSLGSSGADVRILQMMLLTLAEEYENIPFPENNGIYGPMTARAAAAVRSACGIIPGGSTDIFTWNRIARLFNAYISTRR